MHLHVCFKVDSFRVLKAQSSKWTIGPYVQCSRNLHLHGRGTTGTPKLLKRYGGDSPEFNPYFFAFSCWSFSSSLDTLTKYILIVQPWLGKSRMVTCFLCCCRIWLLSGTEFHIQGTRPRKVGTVHASVNTSRQRHAGARDQQRLP